MGRQVRRVPADWVHPTNDQGRLAPLYAGSVSAEQSAWDIRKVKWSEGFRDDWIGGWKPLDGTEGTFDDWVGNRPDPADYMPDWTDDQRTHYQMYETCSEGTPISPVMATPEELARWLADTGASSFAHFTATYEEWLSTILAGSAPSMLMTIGPDGQGTMQSGVEALARWEGEQS